MNLFTETEFFLRTIEDSGAHPLGIPQSLDGVTIQTYCSPDYKSKAIINISDELMAKSAVEFNLEKLKLLELLPVFFPAS